MCMCSLNKNLDYLDELFQCTNKVFDIIAVSETTIRKQTSLTTNINPKTAVGGRGKGGNLTPPRDFSKNISSKESMKPWFYVTFNIVINHIFLKNFIEILQFVFKF